MQLELEAAQEVEVIDASKGDYKSTGNTPSFAMTFAPASLQSGWYYLEAALVRNNGSREASICADIRHAGKESIAIPIPTNLRGTVREVFYLPPNIIALRWIPTAAPGYFSQSHLLLHRITFLESALRRISRVIFDLWRFRNRTHGSNAGLGWWGAIGNLQDAYQRTATLRFRRLMDNDYPAFIAVNDTLNEADIRVMRKQDRQLALHPVVTLIMHVDFPARTLVQGSARFYCRPNLYPLGIGVGRKFVCRYQDLALIDQYRSRHVRIKIVRAKPDANLTIDPQHGA